MKDTNRKIIEAYMRMILEGSAFSNWTNPPSGETRNRIINHILKGEPLNDFIDLERAIYYSRDEEELKRMINEMSIKEDEFMI